MKKLLSNIVKHNPVVEYLYSRYLKNKNREVESYIFVACTGRSGSLTMTKIFDSVEECASFHEPHPKMLSNPEIISNKKNYNYRNFHKLKKFYVMRSAIGYKHYFESNHQFIKTFIDPAIEYFGNKLKIIHLIRDPVGVAKSLYELNDIPGTTLVTLHYYLNPKEKDNLINIQEVLFDDPDFQHEFYKCLWYFYETEARIAAAKKKYSGYFYYKIHTNELNDTKKLEEMFKSLGVTPNTEKLRSLAGTKANTRLEEKHRTIDVDECIQMNNSFVSMLSRKGFNVEEWVENNRHSCDKTQFREVI